MRGQRDQRVERPDHVHGEDQDDEAEHAADARDDHVPVALQGRGAVDLGRLERLLGDPLEAGQDHQHGERQHEPDDVEGNDQPVGPDRGEPERFTERASGDRVHDVVDDAAEVGVEQPGEGHRSHHVRKHVGDEQDAEHDRPRAVQAVDQYGQDVADDHAERRDDHGEADREQHRPAQPRVRQRGRVVGQSDPGARLAVGDPLEAPPHGSVQRHQHETEHHDHARRDQ